MARSSGRVPLRTDPNVAAKRRRLAIAGVVIFVIADIVLVAWAAMGVRTPPGGHSSPGRGDVPTPTATPAAVTPSAPSATPTPTPAADAVAPTRLITALDGETAWRAVTGPCPAPSATVELTTDGGTTWKASDASTPTGASSIIRLTAQSARQASAVALTAQGCTPEFIRTYVAGDNWAVYADQLAGEWYAHPGTSGAVHSPNGDVAAPCPAVVGLAVNGAGTAAVLCANRDVYRTTDGGRDWGNPTNAPAAVAIGSTASGYAIAATGQDGCSGIAVSTLDTGTGAAAPAGCAGIGAPPGDVAISGSAGAIWLWAGDTVLRSTDGGSTWR